MTNSETPAAHIPAWVQIIAGALFCFPLGLIFSPVTYLFIKSYFTLSNNYIIAQRHQSSGRRKQSSAQRRRFAEQRIYSEKEIILNTVGLWLILGVIFSPILNITIHTPLKNHMFPPSSDSVNGETPSSGSPSYEDSSKTKLGSVLDGSDPMSEEKLKLLCFKYTNYDPGCSRLNRDGGTLNLR